jgi:hypothetical protein
MQAELQAHLRMKQADVRSAVHENKHVTKEKEMFLKRQKKRESVLKTLNGMLPGLDTQKEKLAHELELATTLMHKQAEVSTGLAHELLALSTSEKPTSLLREISDCVT